MSYSSPEHRSSYPESNLETALQRYEADLVFFADPGYPLTKERLMRVMPETAQAIDEEVMSEIGWPTRDTAVELRSDARLPRYFVADEEEADYNFAFEVVTGWRTTRIPEAERTEDDDNRGFNNFYATLIAEPFRPSTTEEYALVSFTEPLRASYGSKPYLLRAYMIAPEFMEALRETARDLGNNVAWENALVSGSCGEDAEPKDRSLLRASRLAYGLLTNLMRIDDLQRQEEWSGFGNVAVEIGNPEIELRA